METCAVLLLQPAEHLSWHAPEVLLLPQILSLEEKYAPLFVAM